MAALDGLDWRWIPEATHGGPVQMALEEVAAETVAEGGPALVRVFRWDPSTLSMGYGQHERTVDWDVCDRAGIDVTRRQTGGGGIYHDHFGDISYSIVVPSEAVSARLLEAYHTLCEPIIHFFDRLGIDAAFAETEREAVYEPSCFLRDIHPAHDIVVDGRKICGNAQYRQREAVIQHGSILFENVPDVHVNVFASHDVGVEALEARTTTIVEHGDVDRESAVATLAEVLRDWAAATEGAWSSEELAAAETLAEEKYEADSWIRGPAGGEAPDRSSRRD